VATVQGALLEALNKAAPVRGSVVMPCSSVSSSTWNRRRLSSAQSSTMRRTAGSSPADIHTPLRSCEGDKLLGQDVREAAEFSSLTASITQSVTLLRVAVNIGLRLAGR